MGLPKSETAYNCVARFIATAYLEPALQRGDLRVTIRPHEVWRGLNGAYGLVMIHGLLTSRRFLERFSLSEVSGRDWGTRLPPEYTFDLTTLRATVAYVTHAASELVNCLTSDPV